MSERGDHIQSARCTASGIWRNTGELMDARNGDNHDAVADATAWIADATRRLAHCRAGASRSIPQSRGSPSVIWRWRRR
ncbi:Uncharacterised protein [Mycobacteroides abscessus subsp. abscessus]|nr:Uncharacterised protein [Mycobacteroides abscessus subsp. abscessus]